MSEPRFEHDSLGIREVPGDALYGIHALRATENFPFPGYSVDVRMIRAYGEVKLACTRMNIELGALDTERAAAIETACHELIEGKLDRWIIVPSLQGGAGTSLNMNVNEVLANRALQILSKPPGNTTEISPLEHVNLHQSTNDTFPTALRIAAIRGLRDLERDVTALVEAFQTKEREFAPVVKVGRTQMQDAVLVTLGREMGAYADAFARDRWRISRCEERLRVVNLGGTAIGTGLGAPRAYIFGVVEKLREITGLGLARAENLIDATQNVDAFVEVSGILKAHATSLLKIAGDLRLLASGPDAGFGEIRLPARQAGSSIMPGKVNPVVPEAVSQAAIRVMANDVAIAHAVSLGSLELNPYLPLIATTLLENLRLLATACRILADCVSAIEADTDRCRAHVNSATASVTALIPAIGYAAALALAVDAASAGCTVRDLAIERDLVSAEQYDRLISPDAVTRLGS
jgi:aspartate ammonia-lyase